MKNILIVVPSRQRNAKHLEFIEAWKEATNGESDICFGLDSDDASAYERISGVMYSIADRQRMCHILNRIALDNADKYETIAFMGDDHRTRTQGFEAIVTKAMGDMGGGFVYGNDLLQGRRLPTAVFASSKIVKALGWMAPPCLRHLYLDNFWKHFGNAIGRLKYLPSLIIEHVHYANGKAPQDALYREVNSEEMNSHDRLAYSDYTERAMPLDIQKVLCLLN